MKLGINYMVFNGEELLEFAISSIKNHVDHVSVIYQPYSYFGNPAGSDLLPTLDHLKSVGLVDELICFECNLSARPKINEVNMRNIGLEASRRAGCTHHISADVDEFYFPDQLEYVKGEMEGDYDFSIVHLDTYYKDPRWLILPHYRSVVSLIHPVSNSYNTDIRGVGIPFYMERTRRLLKGDRYRVFSREEMVVHHMSYVRKNMAMKLRDSNNGRRYCSEEFVLAFENYNVGDRLCLRPDYINRRTVEIGNPFGIHF